MGNLPVVPRSVNPTITVSRKTHVRAFCPWCDSEMYLNRSGNRFLCVDSINCGAVVSVGKGVA
jgi:hypothetical protein